MNDIHLLTGAYAMDALDELERARFEVHLAKCADCADEVASLREAAAFLAEDLAMTPPPSLRASVLSDISQVRPLPPVIRTGERRSTVARLFPVLVAAAAALVIGGAITVWSPWSDEVGNSTVAGLTPAERVLQADDAISAEVDLGEMGQATVVRSASENRAVVVTEDLVPPPEGKVFQVWLQTPENDMLPAGLMEPVPDQTLVLDGDAAEVIGAGITVEPEGGSPAPTTKPIALFDLA